MLRYVSLTLVQDWLCGSVTRISDRFLGARSTYISPFADITPFLWCREYLQQMSELIQDNEGTIDKYIGDAIMALWNAPRAVYGHEVKACESALLYQARLDTANMGVCCRLYRLDTANMGVCVRDSVVRF